MKMINILTRLIISLTTAVCMLTPTMAEVGDDGLHKQEWFALTFNDIEEDMRDAKQQGKRLVLLFEQPGCSFCAQMHETLLSDKEIVKYIKDHYVVVQYHLWGDKEVTDLDGEILTEKLAAEKWGTMFTPNWVFLPETVKTGKPVVDVAVGQMPGVYDKGTFLDIFTWVYEKGYHTDESFPRYHARRDAERRESDSSKQ